VSTILLVAPQLGQLPTLYATAVTAKVRRLPGLGRVSTVAAGAASHSLRTAGFGAFTVSKSNLHVRKEGTFAILMDSHPWNPQFEHDSFGAPRSIEPGFCVVQSLLACIALCSQ
jgi:hypothetical protein